MNKRELALVSLVEYLKPLSAQEIWKLVDAAVELVNAKMTKGENDHDCGPDKPGE